MLGGLDWGKRMYTCNRRRAIKLIPDPIYPASGRSFQHRVTVGTDHELVARIESGDGLPDFVVILGTPDLRALDLSALEATLEENRYIVVMQNSASILFRYAP